MKKSYKLLLPIAGLGLLILTACSGESPVDDSSQPEEAMADQGEGEITTLYVGPETVDCEGEGPQTCLLVKDSPEDEYQFFYSQIEGFNYEPGYEYELRVLVEPVENPPAGGSSLKYTLVEEVNKTPAGESDQGGSEIVTFFVGPETVECEGEGPQTCMLVKENPADDYQLFYDQIDGFTFEPGYEYELTVLVEPVENPPAGGSSLQYSLVEEVSKTPAAETAVDIAVLDPVSGTIWKLDSYLNETNEETALFPESEISLGFVTGQFNGTAGCNNYFGSYQIDGENITFGETASTERFCLPEELMAQESAYLTLLGQVRTFSSGQDQLILYNDNGDPLLTYSTKVPATLVGTVWQAIGYNNGRGGVTSLIQDTEITAVFSEDGTLSGSAGCNSYNTSYEADDQNLSISELMAVTLRACPEDIGQQESEYLAALLLAATYTIEGDRLQIRDENGALLADYTAVPPLGLTDVNWVVTAYNIGSEAVSSVINGTRLTASFQPDGTITGSAGCNNFNGAYVTDGSQIEIGPLGATQKACAEDIMQQENAYLAALQTATTFSISGDVLQLRAEDGALMVSFTAEPPQVLAGSSWDVLSYNNGNQAVVSVIIGTEMTAEFGEDGQLTGFAGCNNYSAAYEADEENITIGPAISTQMACAEDIMTQELQYLTALSTAATYRIDGHLLEMRTAEGARAATFQAADYIDPQIIRYLEQATYQLEMAESGEVTLENGEYSEPIVAGSASELKVVLTDKIATGTLNGQGAVAAVIAADSGGSGTFYYLAVFTPADGGLANTATTLLGDRVQVNSIDITSNTIVVDMIEHGEDDPLCCPSQQVINTYELVDNALNLLDSQPVSE